MLNPHLMVGYNPHNFHSETSVTPITKKKICKEKKKGTMKISNAVLALAFIQSASAFFVNPGSPQEPHFLKSTPESAGVGQDIAAPNPQGNTGLKTYGGAGGKSKKSGGAPNVIVQGGSLRTWSFPTPLIERVQVVLTTGGRPLNADVDLWQGPDNTPQKMAVYIEDGALRPFNCIIETPRGQNTIAVLNTASLEYPLTAQVSAGAVGEDVASLASEEGKIIQGGAIKTYSFGSPVGSVQILLKTDGRPLNSRIELLQGPNNNKQVIDIYTEDGLDRPFYAVIETPGSGNVIRIVNTATMEYPVLCSVEPYSVEPGFDESSTQGSWDQTNDASFFFLGGK